MKQSTLVHSVKDKYVIRSQHAQVGALKFYPVCSSEAKRTIEKEFVHSLGDTDVASLEREKQKLHATSYTLKDNAVHHGSAFLATSPVTQDAK